ncbi:MAG: immune inhibitor A [Ardenticatenaceae bacterium]|nr:immune inhibitor A [Ardenticatenaceae bacterium]MCB9446497.1 immune inhibitor A [Ardenticatenaceae bacterium]
MLKRPFWMFFILLLTACTWQEPLRIPVTPTTVPPTTAPPTETIERKPTETAVPPTNEPTNQPTNQPTWPAAMAPLKPFADTAVTHAQQATFDELNQSMPPERDDIALAEAYRGAVEPPPAATPVAEPLTVGTHQTFNINNLVDNTIVEIDAVLAAVSDHGYFWFDTGPESVDPDPALLAEVESAFDTIYETDTFYFGPESNPGIDGDPHVYVVHASPLALCGSVNCGFAGYFTADNVLPQTANPDSNQHEMFIMNSQQFGTGFYLNVLGHEFRHMIEDNHDRGDADWHAEGSATLAEELLGYPDSGQQRGNAFLSNPDQQLNSWVDSAVASTLPYYGMGYVLNRYIFDRLGSDLYRQFATSPAYGLRAVDAVAAANGLDLTGQQLWLDWLVALAIHNDPNAPEKYQFKGTPLDTVAMTSVKRSQDFDTTVGQYAVDYYELPDGPMTINFQGEQLVPLLNTVPYSGEAMWYAQRANYSDARLTRTVDLTSVDSATLQYAVYADIEQGYDFGYVSVSVDNGRTWQGLTAKGMQGLAEEDNPSGSAYTDRFYTGRTQAWVEESIDLTPYAGQVIQLRFEYITDLILTFGGLAIDNIAIPEIGFYDDAETLADGWTAEGFTRATGYIPQSWHLQLVTFENDVPVVETLSLNEDQTLSLTLDESRRPILIAAASAPFTLEPAHYRLSIQN